MSTYSDNFSAAYADTLAFERLPPVYHPAHVRCVHAIGSPHSSGPKRMTNVLLGQGTSALDAEGALMVCGGRCGARVFSARIRESSP